MADLYNSELTVIVDQMLPWRRLQLLVVTRPTPGLTTIAATSSATVKVSSVERHAWKSSDARMVWKSELRAYRRLTGSKREAFWSRLITDQRSKPRHMWQSIDKMLGRGHLQGCDDINASDFHSFFDKNVADIRASTSNAAVPPFTSTGSVFSGFIQPVTKDEVPLPCAHYPISSAPLIQFQHGFLRNAPSS